MAHHGKGPVLGDTASCFAFPEGRTGHSGGVGRH